MSENQDSLGVPVNPFVLEETPDLLIIEKPPGMSSVRLPTGGETSVVDWVLAHYPNQATVGEKLEDAGALYRLDRDTSGLLIFAKTSLALDFYRSLWKTDHTRKAYRAITSVSVKAPQTILFPIGRSEKSKGKSIPIITELDARKIRGSALRSVTHIEKCDPAKAGLGFRLTTHIETGSPHQIRCHLSAIGAPILGDTLYGGKPAERLYLHCQEISFPERENPEQILHFSSSLGFTDL